MEQEREDLDALVRSDGWTVFCAHVAHEWGTAEAGGGTVFLAAVKKAADIMDDPTATAQLRQILASQREIHKLLAGVPERIKQLKAADSGAAAPLAWSRRGGL